MVTLMAFMHSELFKTKARIASRQNPRDRRQSPLEQTRSSPLFYRVRLRQLRQRYGSYSGSSSSIYNATGWFASRHTDRYPAASEAGYQVCPDHPAGCCDPRTHMHPTGSMRPLGNHEPHTLARRAVVARSARSAQAPNVTMIVSTRVHYARLSTVPSRSKLRRWHSSIGTVALVT